jgi:hypothetical protein
MEKRRPQYDLATIKRRVSELGVAAFTKTSLDGEADGAYEPGNAHCD